MTLFRIGAIAFGAFALVLVAVLVVGALLPGTWTAEGSAMIRADPEAIFAHLETAEAWDAWTPSPDSGYEHFGPRTGEGSGRAWDDPTYGQGRFVIRDLAPPRRIAYDVEVEAGAILIQGTIELEKVDDATAVRWREVGNFGWNPLLGFLAGRMEEMQGDQLDASLQRLKALVEEEAVEGGSSGVGSPDGTARVSPQRFARLN
ncbi:MAG: SRPBCC family protein [Gemmatimonadota bacterium]